ncbi:MAG TPA: phosphatase PAP2 family protein [Bacilli bacterium]|nr:phosphatase PAP2 family protein [Bacilli bacterium]
MKKNKLLIVLILSFIALSLFMINGNFIYIDKEAFSFLSSHLNDSYIDIFEIITNIVSWWSLLIICIIIFTIMYKKKKINDFKFLLINIFSSMLITRLFKIIFQRERPIWPLINETGYSYPSGHTLTATCFYGTLIILVNKYLKGKLKIFVNIFLVIMIILTGLSRIYLGVHYLSDVIAGYILGVIVLIIVYRIFNKK